MKKVWMNDVSFDIIFENFSGMSRLEGQLRFLGFLLLCRFLSEFGGEMSSFEKWKMSGFRLPISSRSSKKVFLKAFVLEKSGLIALICCFLSLIFYACICFSNGPWTKLLSNQMKVTKDLLKEKNSFDRTGSLSTLRSDNENSRSSFFCFSTLWKNSNGCFRGFCALSLSFVEYVRHLSEKELGNVCKTITRAFICFLDDLTYWKKNISYFLRALMMMIMTQILNRLRW